MPNGLAFSPDESILYINDTFRGHIRAFDIGKDGSVGKGRIFTELKGDGPGAPMECGLTGRVMFTVPGREEYG